jgi:hypothetical protein
MDSRTRLVGHAEESLAGRGAQKLVCDSRLRRDERGFAEDQAHGGLPVVGRSSHAAGVKLVEHVASCPTTKALTSTDTVKPYVAVEMSNGIPACPVGLAVAVCMVSFDL